MCEMKFSKSIVLFIDFRIGYTFICPTIFTLILQCVVLVPHFSNGVLLPKRIVSQISEKLKVPNYSSYELEEAFNLGKNMVVQKLRHENDLIKDGMKLKIKFL